MDWLSCFPMEWLSEVLLLKGVNGELVSAFVYSERGIVENFWEKKTLSEGSAHLNFPTRPF